MPKLLYASVRFVPIFLPFRRNYALYEKKLNEVIREIIRNDLSEMQRKTIVYVFYEGYTHSQIAELMDVNRSTVENHIGRALEKIRMKLKERNMI